MTTIGARAVSFRVGEIRLADVRPQLGEIGQFIVRVLDNVGIERQVHLRFTEKWGGSWQRQLECPRCGGPARVLAVHDGAAACGRCRSRRTGHHRHKNSRAWREEGSLADQITRAALRGTSSAGRSSTKRLVQRLKDRSIASSAVAHDSATRLIRAVDLAGLICQ